MRIETQVSQGATIPEQLVGMRKPMLDAGQPAQLQKRQIAPGVRDPHLEARIEAHTVGREYKTIAARKVADVRSHSAGSHDRVKAALTEALLKGVITRQEYDADLAEVFSPPEDDPFEVNALYHDLLEEATSYAIIAAHQKHMSGHKPLEEKHITLMAQTSDHIADHLGETYKIKAIPYGSEETAELVVWDAPSDDTAGPELARVINHVDHHGGVLYARNVPPSLESQFAEQPDGRVVEMASFGSRRAVVYQRGLREEAALAA